MAGLSVGQSIGLAVGRPLSQPGAGGGGFDPASLFGPSDHGAIIDLSTASLLFQSNAGTGAVSADNDPIGYATDLGPDERPALQGTAASKPLWSGAPRTLGSELVTNGGFATDTDWTKGTGWTIGSGVATKSAGSASVLSQDISLTAGKTYFVTYQITRTAGSVTARFTGGTTVTGTARSYRGSYVDLLVAVTGNTTLEFSADATFAGTVDNVTVKEVASYVNRGARFDGTDFLRSATNDLSGSDKATLVISFQNGQNALAAVIAEHGNYNANLAGSLQFIQNAGWLGRLRGDTASAIMEADPSTESLQAVTYHSNVFTAVADIAGASIADELFVRIRGVDATQSASGTTAGGGNLANSAFTIGTSGNAVFLFNGLIHRAILINRKLTSGEIVQAEEWCRAGMAYCAQLGDSTVSLLASNVGQPQAMPIHSLVGGMICGSGDLARSGDRIDDQLSDWAALSDKEALEAVFVQVGLNDVKGRVGENTATTAEVIADLQNLVDTVNADKPAGCKTYICGLTPCKAWLDLATNPTAAYQAWLDVNEAIAGNGSTPITGVDGRITSHVAALNDGSGNLAPEYDMDGVHENNAARFIIAQAWRAQLEADGLV